MGKSLHFEDAVRETLELQKSFKCKNAVCETQTWKLKHQLDLAKFKVERLRKELGLVNNMLLHFGHVSKIARILLSSRSMVCFYLSKELIFYIIFLKFGYA